MIDFEFLHTDLALACHEALLKHFITCSVCDLNWTDNYGLFCPDARPLLKDFVMAAAHADKEVRRGVSFV